MTQDEYIFNTLFRDVGGRYMTPPTGFLVDFHQRMNNLAELMTAYDPVRRRLLIDYFSSHAINAGAISQGETDYIGIAGASTSILIGIFGRMMAHPEIFPGIGDTKLETAPIPFTGAMSGNIARHGQRNNFLLPKNTQRFNHALILTTLAMDFLFLHELTHLRNGHVSLITGGAPLLEVRDASGRSPILDPLTRQALEMDADSVAISQTINFGFSQVNPLSPDFAYRSRENILYTILFACTTLFKTFEAPGEWENLGVNDHPPAALRSLIIGAAMSAHTEEEAYYVPRSKFVPITGRTVRHCMRAWATVTGTKPDVSGLRRAATSVGQEHLKLIEQRWKEIRPNLDKVKRSPRLN